MNVLVSPLHDSLLPLYLRPELPRRFRLLGGR